MNRETNECFLKPESQELTEVVYKPTVESEYPHQLKFDEKKTTTLFLYFSAVSSNLVQLSYGMMAAWISPVSESILLNDPLINPLGASITTIQLSIIGAAQGAGASIGPLFCGKIFDMFGRKRCLTVICLVMTISIITLALSSQIIIYYVTLFFVGVCTGAVNVGLPVYISEITEDHNRGKMSCLVNIGSPLGNVITFLIGSYLSVRIFTLCCAIPVALNTLLLLTVLPDSPVQMILSNEINKARKILKKLRNKNSNEIEAEIKRIDHELQETSNSSEGGCSRILTDRSSRNGLIIGMGGYLLFVICGVSALTTYLQIIFNKTSTSLPSNLSAFVVSTVSIACYIAATIAVDKWGRRNIMLLSTASSSIPLFITGTYFYLKVNGYCMVENLGWFPIFGMVLFICLNVSGTATIPVALMNELFINQVKATAISIIVLVAGIMTSLTLFAFPIIMEFVGVAWCYWIFSTSCLLGSLFVYFFVPETKGKSILEIQEILKHLVRK